MRKEDLIDFEFEFPKLYKTQPHDCSYLPDRTAATLFIDPSYNMNNTVYSHFARLGFRRSGEHVYRPHCPGCSACLSLRVPVEAFKASRSQRRILKANAHLSMQVQRAGFTEQHYRLYLRYMHWRHPGGGMDVDDPEAYHRLYSSAWADTWMYCFYDQQTVVAVAITDQLDDGLSAVYTFYEPALAHQGLGTFAILQQIEQARQQQLPYVYLGYWVNGCDKMEYKVKFRPYQLFMGTVWQTEPQIS
jgi:arginine-tRNA-protein transferase